MINQKIILIIKPTNRCNLRCSYCYHSEKGYEDSSSINSTELETIFNFFKKTNLEIIWHGGEPLLMGPKYYYQAIGLEKKYFSNEIKNRFQSNGTLINPEYCEFFKNTNSALGLSYDGVANDDLRGDSAALLNVFELLHQEKVPFGIIHVLTKQNIHFLIDDYRKYKEMNIHVKFKIVFPVNNLLSQDSIHYPEILSNLLDLYDEWFFDTNCKISVSSFEQIIRMYFHASTECIYSSCLGKFLCIDPEMNLWPCGRNYPDKYCLGNLEEYSCLHDIYNTDVFKSILSESISKRQRCKESCEHYQYCHSGCINDSIMAGGIGDLNTHSCTYVKKFIDHTRFNLNIDRPKNRFITSFLRNVIWL